MNNIDTYIKAISLLYIESQITTKQINSKEFVKEVLKYIKPNKKSFYGGVSSIEDRLVELIQEILGIDYPIPEKVLLDSLNTNLQDDPQLLEGAKSIIFKKFENDEERLDNIRYTKAQLNRRVTSVKLKADINKTVMRMNTDSSVDVIKIADILKKKIETVTVDNGVEGLPNSFSEPVDITDVDKVADILEEDLQTDGSRRIRTGWQSINKMLNGGFIRGESVMALFNRNNYKSGFVRSLLAQAAMYNKPVMLDKSKKPLLLLISLEDSILETYVFLYKYLYYDEHGVLPSGEARSKKFLAKYIQERLSINGYHVKVIKATASKSIFEDIEQAVAFFENKGYEIHMLVVDYLSKLSIANISGANDSVKYAELWKMFKDLVSEKKIVGISPHQASSALTDLLKSGIASVDVVKEMKGKDYIQHSKAINQVVDLTIIGHIAKYNRKPVLTLQRDRRRYPEIVEERYLYTVFPFPKDTPIPSDLNREDISIRVDSSYEEE